MKIFRCLKLNFLKTYTFLELRQLGAEARQQWFFPQKNKFFCEPHIKTDLWKKKFAKQIKNIEDMVKSILIQKSPKNLSKEQCRISRLTSAADDLQLQVSLEIFITFSSSPCCPSAVGWSVEHFFWECRTGQLTKGQVWF